MIRRRTSLAATDDGGALTIDLIGVLLEGWASTYRDARNADDFSEFVDDETLAALWVRHEHLLIAEAKRLRIKPTSICYWSSSKRPVYYGVFLLRARAHRARQHPEEV